MSIPLVQNNEKDSINTSIIAIKRNIERINMLLGLSNSEEIDTSKFATKDELQQAVTDLQPVDEVTVDNMRSVSSNAVAKCLAYSTTEHKTGAKWIDGKPIYRMTFYSATNWADGTILGNITNLHTVIDIRDITTFEEGTIYTNYVNGGNYALTAVGSNHNIAIQRGGGFVNSLPSLVIIEYTKTTD